MGKKEVFLGWRIAHVPRLYSLQDELYEAAGVKNKLVCIGEYKTMTDKLAEQGSKHIDITLSTGICEKDIQEFTAAHYKDEKIIWDGEDITQGITDKIVWLTAMNHKVTEESRKHLIIHATRCYEHVKKCIEENNVVCALISNEWLYPARTVRLLCEKNHIPFVHSEQGLFSGTTVIDQKGVGVNSSLTKRAWKSCLKKGLSAADYFKAQEALKNLQENGRQVIPEGSHYTPREIYRKLKLNPNKPVLLVPAQIDADSNVLRWSKWFPTNVSVLRALIPVLDKYNVILKIHPLRTHIQNEKDRFKCAFPEVFVVDNIHLKSLFQITDLLVTRTSTVGAEAMVQGIPTITLGDSIYSGRGITIDVRDRAKLPDAIAKTLELTKSGKFWDADRSYRRLVFIWWVLTKHLFIGKKQEPVEGLHEISVARIKKLLKLDGGKDEVSYHGNHGVRGAAPGEAAS